MKTLLITIIAIGMLSLAVSAQTNTFPSSGNVGIGTTSPGNSLSFQDLTDNSTAGITWYSPAPLTYGIYRTSGTWVSPNYQQLNISWGTGILLSPGASFGKSYVEVTGGGLRVTSGKVGIGTTTPGSPLEIAAPSVANGASNALFLLNPSNTVGAGAAIIFGGPSNAYSTGSIRGYLFNAGSGGTGKLILGSKSTGTSNDELTLYGGKVGIGTQNPDQLLTVNGTIHSKSVIVDLTVVPDYVFKPAYKLPSLDYVKNYIEKNSHLPEVPSEAEIKKNGLDVGEMNAILLKKIEEMTLYMLEKDKQVKTLQAKQAQLEKQVEQLINAKK